METTIKIWNKCLISAILFRPFGLLAAKNFYLCCFLYFDYELPYGGHFEHTTFLLLNLGILHLRPLGVYYLQL
jgi:hypothetical protein